MSVPRFAELLLRPAPEPDISWGLYVYRATYEDQDLWERYIEYIRNAVISRLHPLSDNNSESDHSRFKRLRDSFQLFIKEDNNWDNLTLFQIRNIFDVDRLTIPCSWGSWMQELYFIYVNKEVLMDFKAIDDSRHAPTPNYFGEEVAFIVVLAQAGWRGIDEMDEDDEDYAIAEWQNVCAYWFSEFYDLNFRDGGGWDTFFVAPPRKWKGY